MSDYQKFFLKPKHNNAPKPSIAVAGFGKHPGWYDHIESLGEMTPSLVMAKKLLYTDGIGGVIDSGEWETHSNDLVDLDHTFIWQRWPEAIIGKFWASKDKAGRSHYPMVACAHCSHLPFDTITRTVLPQLEHIKSLCQKTKNTAAVEAAFARSQQSLAQSLHTQRRATNVFALESPPPAFEAYLADTAHHAGLQQILNYIEQHLAAYNPTKKRIRNSPTPNSTAAPLRVSALDTDPTIGASFLGWLWFLRSQLDSDTPILLTYSQQTHGCDVFIGEPTAAQFSALRKRCSPHDHLTNPLTEPFMLRAESVIDSMVHRGFHPIPSIFAVNKVASPPKAKTPPTSHKTAQPSLAQPVQSPPQSPTEPQPAPAPASSSASKQRKPWLALAAAAGVGVALGIAALLFITSPKTPPPLIASKNQEWRSHEPNTRANELNIAPESQVAATKPTAPAINPAHQQAGQQYINDWITWVEPLIMFNSTPEFKQIFAQPSAAAIAPALQNIEALHPRHMLGFSITPNENISQVLPHDLLTNPECITLIQQANGRILHLKNTLLEWPLWSHLQSASKQFAAMQATALSQAIAAQAQTPTLDDTLADHISAAIALHTKISTAQHALTHLQTTAQQFAQYQDPHLNQAWLVYRHTLSRSSTIDAFIEQLTTLQAFNQELAQFLDQHWTSNIDHLNRRKALQSRDRLKDIAALKAWYTNAQQHTLLPTAQDPRTPQIWHTMLHTIHEQIALLPAQLQATLNPQYTACKTTLESLLNLPLTQANLSPLENNIAAFKNSLKHLEQQLSDARILDIDAWLNNVYGKTFSDPDIQAQWNLYCIHVIGLPADSAQAFKQEPHAFKRTRAWMENALACFKALETHPQLPPPTLPLVNTSQANPFNSFIPYYQLKRQALLEAIIPATDIPPPTADAYSTSNNLKHALSQFQTEVTAPLQQLSTALPQAHQHIKQAHPWNDIIAATIYSIKHNPLLAQFADDKSVSAILNDIFHYARIHTLDNANDLLPFLMDTQQLIWKSIAAAQRLHAIEWKPDSIQASDRALALWLRLRDRVIAAALPQTRKTQLAATLTQQSQALWHTYAEQLPPQQLHYAFGAMQTVGITAEDLPQDMQFKRILLTALNQLKDTPHNQATACKDDLIVALQPLSSNNPSSTITDFLTTLNHLEDTPSVNLEKLRFKGPGTMRKWQATWENDGETVSYTHTDHPELQLKFQLVAESNRPFYLTTEEVSVGLFFNVLEKLTGRVNATPPLKQWLQKIKPPSDELSTWSVTRSKPTFTNPQAPMQNIPPQIAATFCKMLSCRLPSPKEWTTLQTRYLTQYADSQLWNLGEPGDGVPAANATHRGATSTSPFSNVNQHHHPNTATIPFYHLLGNVAEYLQTPNTHSYWAIGGSATSNPTTDPLKSNTVSAEVTAGYPNIGFRLAFYAPSGVPYKVKLKRALERALQQ